MNTDNIISAANNMVNNIIFTSSFDNRKRKHNHVEIKNLKDDGLSAKEISEKLDIPLRTVYYILNKK